MATIDELRARAELIAEEQQIGGNTAERVGEAFDMVADIIEAVAPGDEQAVLYNPQSPNEAQKAQARANIGAQETISDIADYVKVSAQTFTAAQKQQARENIGAEQAGDAVKNLAGSASDTETRIKAANNPNLQANIHLSGNNIYVNGIAGGIDLDNNGVNIKAGNSGYPNAKVKVNGEEVATNLYVDGKIDDRATNIEDALALIEAVIPSQASAQNQLADKDFVNSSISSSTANFVGTFNSLSELQAVQNPTNNDYGFVIETDAVGNEYYDRYKYNGTAWLFEYKVESTTFTAAQWAAIQSGITSALVTKLNALPTNSELSTALNAKADKSDTYTKAQVDSALGGKQNVISDLDTIRSGASLGATAVQPVTMNTALEAKADKSDTYTKAEIGNLITPIDSEVIVGALPASGVANTIYRVPGTGSYTDYGWDGTQFVPLATYDGDLTAAVGYYDCPTVATTAAKVVSASGYVLAKGGCFKVKFAHANNVGNPTLNVNGTGAKPLYWEGGTPTLYEGWKDNEVVSVYYDGAAYQAHRIYESLKDLKIYTGVRLISATQAKSTASLNRPLFGAPLMEKGKEYLIVVRVDATITITQLYFGSATTSDWRILPNGSYTLEAGKDYMYWFTPSIDGCDRLFLASANTADVNTVVRIYEKVDEDIQTSLSLIRANVANVDNPYLNSSWMKGALQAGRVNTSNNRFVSEFLRYPYDITLTISQGFMQIVYTYTDGESSLLSDYTVNTITIPANTIFRVGIRRVTEQSAEDDSAATEFGRAIQIGNLVSKEVPTLNLFGAAISGYALRLSSVNVGDYVTFNKYATSEQRTLVIPVKDGQVLNVHCRNYSPYAPVIFIGMDSQLLGGLLAASGRILEAKGDYTAPADGYAILNHNISYFTPYCYVDGLTADSLRENHLKTSIRQLYDTPRYDNLLRQGQNNGVQTYRQSLSLLWFSDIHGNQANVERIVEFEGMYHRYFNDIIHTGDSVHTVADDGMAFWTGVKGSNKILNVVGNHDSAKMVGGAFSWYELTEQETYQLLFSTVSDWRVTQPSDAASAGKCYYYKDYNTEKVRLIAIDGMSANSSQTRYDSEQVEWFTQTLSDARTNGLSVIVACHFAPQHHNIDSPWSNSVGYTGAPPYATLEDFVSAIGDFIDAGGEFVCWMCGDTHIDEFGLVNSDERQLVIVVGSAGSYYINDFARSAFSETQDLFNVLCVNTQLKVVKLLRIGCDTDINHSKRVPYAYNYATKERVSRI